ncbi:LamB/YcsF family protein [Luteimonas sp. SJ-92]|uniref:LamB/YcsF family protein n=1 Tax=Luteimonas salinisoli TaxID=2752307 RepID=A0A853JAN8_9GAMM|nr:5-oxoprolinase subunit PxpA [Luteimonas salinisoli]NZA25905.1 LamB/YcsF family protein [Luteimonas salinisoli]
MTRRIDFNCDMGEGCGDDPAIAPYISSASIACGGHAGDEDTMGATVALCLRHGVAVGAHPSFEDREHFGRREQTLAPAEIAALVGRQTAALQRVCDPAGARLHHVKPHGALYNLAARDAAVAAAIVGAVRALDDTLVLYALAGSALARAGREAGLRVAEEVFAERGYDADGRLLARGLPGAELDLDAAIAQVRTMLREGVVVAADGSRVPVRADTLCLHGDRPGAAAFARRLRAALEAEGVSVMAPHA